MLKFADLLEVNAERLGKMESAAMGQPITVAKGAVAGTANYWRYYAGYCGKIHGDSFVPDGDGTYKIVQYEPLGVCAGMSSFFWFPLSVYALDAGLMRFDRYQCLERDPRSLCVETGTGRRGRKHLCHQVF